MKIKYECIYPFSLNDFHFLYDGENGMIYSSAESLNHSLTNIRRSEIIPKTDEEKVEELISMFESDRTSQSNLIRNCTTISKKQWMDGKVVHKLWLSLTESCNMNCKYCFGNYGENDAIAIMSKAMAQKCIDYFFHYANKNVAVYSIRFFGGEPLLNMEVLKFCINYINDIAKKLHKTIDYLLTTNGTIISDEIIQLILDNEISVNISIDGNQQVHDFNRVFKQGQGSFARTTKFIKRLKDFNYQYIIARMTLSKPGVATFKDDIKYLWELGFDQIYMDIVETDNKELLLDDNDLQSLNQQMDEVLNLMMEQYLDQNYKSLRNITDGYHFIDQRLLKESCMFYNPFTLQFTPNGNIYKCCRTMNQNDEFAGNIDDGIDWNKFYRKISVNDQCYHCWAKRLCGGGCKSIEHRDLYCQFVKMIYTCSLKYYIFLKQNVDKFNLDFI